MFAERLSKWLSKPIASKGQNQPDNLNVVLSTDIGLRRKENQDRVVAMRVNTPFSSGRHFFVIALADGMGGMKDGAQCASLTLSTFLYSLIRYRALPPEERLIQSALDSNKSVHEFSQGNGGATLSAIIIEPGSNPCTLNIGDSRIYTYKKKIKNSLKRLTIDDSLEEVFGGDDKSLLQFVGMGQGIKPHTQYLSHEGDYYCLTSDGIHFIDESVFDDILFHSQELNQAAIRLGQYVRWCGAHDNASIALVDCDNIIQSLNNYNDIGIEVWDPFSQLHILWMKNDSNSAGYFEQNTLDKESFNQEASNYENEREYEKPRNLDANQSYQDGQILSQENISESDNSKRNTDTKLVNESSSQTEHASKKEKADRESNQLLQPELFEREGSQNENIKTHSEDSKTNNKKTMYYKKQKKTNNKKESDENQASIRVVGDNDNEKN
ncbi:PP2C family protein-serine/threonine phosphatase [Pantoea stewartii]|uniref:PP2C family protein-serine/threonine phosphatase n=1 Tax=Pantoea stewartii TaxID=66269 RepID=UPI0019817FFE|nr:PP2C family serine/threonine-protein phosphatase [Pantoea stewartii]